jgi:hypothetical protein
VVATTTELTSPKDDNELDPPFLSSQVESLLNDTTEHTLSAEKIRGK